MKKNIILFSLLIIFSISLVSASIDNLGTRRQGTCFQLPQTCSTCTYNNISSVITPSGNYSLLGEYAMDKSFQSYNLTYCLSDDIGTYLVSGHGDLGGVDQPFTYTFQITPSGFLDTSGFYIIALALIVLITILGFGLKEAWFVVIGGMALIMLGIYSINYGIVGFRDMFMTWGFGLFEIGIGAILSISSAWQKIEED